MLVEQGSTYVEMIGIYSATMALVAGRDRHEGEMREVDRGRIISYVWSLDRGA